jgi:hypothetical protein
VKLTIRREKSQPSHDCTLGLLLIPEVSLTLCSLERPWIPSTTCKGGLKGKSCVPCGTYQLMRHDSVKHPKTWALVNFDLDVIHYEGDDHDPDEDRATCLIHPANFAHQLEGCIAPGLAHSKAGEEFMVTSSVRAMDRLRSLVPWTDKHELRIEEAT